MHLYRRLKKHFIDHDEERVSEYFEQFVLLKLIVHKCSLRFLLGVFKWNFVEYVPIMHANKSLNTTNNNYCISCKNNTGFGIIKQFMRSEDPTLFLE